MAPVSEQPDLQVFLPDYPHRRHPVYRGLYRHVQDPLWPRLRACGEHPQAADSVGINVYKMRYAGVLISGFLGGIGGLAYTVAAGSGFNLTWAAMGFLALVQAIFGNWKPFPILASSVFLRCSASSRLTARRCPSCRSSMALRRSPILPDAAVYRHDDRADLHLQELSGPQGRGHPLR